MPEPNRTTELFDMLSKVLLRCWVFGFLWGAQPEPAVWQYYVRKGSVDDMRPDGDLKNSRQ